MVAEEGSVTEDVPTTAHVHGVAEVPKRGADHVCCQSPLSVGTGHPSYRRHLAQAHGGGSYAPLGARHQLWLLTTAGPCPARVRGDGRLGSGTLLSLFLWTRMVQQKPTLDSVKALSPVLRLRASTPFLSQRPCPLPLVRLRIQEDTRWVVPVLGWRPERAERQHCGTAAAEEIRVQTVATQENKCGRPARHKGGPAESVCRGFRKDLGGGGDRVEPAYCTSSRTLNSATPMTRSSVIPVLWGGTKTKPTPQVSGSVSGSASRD